MPSSYLAIPLTLLVLLIPLFLYRLHSILPSSRKRPIPRHRGSPTHLLIVLGSGGHTAEMISMLRTCISQGLKWSDYTHRTWVIGSGDEFSGELARMFEEEMGEVVQGEKKGESGKAKDEKGGKGGYRIVQVTRARKIHQSLVTTPWSCFLCFWDCLRVLVGPFDTSSTTSSKPTTDKKSNHHHHHSYPDLILTNGPATATILILSTLFLRFLGLHNLNLNLNKPNNSNNNNNSNNSQANTQGQMKTIYIESWARVKKMSLSGRILSFWVDRCLVQWQGLEGKGLGGRGEFRGSLVG